MSEKKNIVASVLNHLDFDGDTLRKAIEATFQNRETPVSAEEFEAFTTAFADGHRVQWNAFVKEIGEAELADALGKVVEDLKRFAMPVFRSLARDEKLKQQWKAGQGWVAS